MLQATPRLPGGKRPRSGEGGCCSRRIRKRDPRFPRPRGTVLRRPAGTGTTAGQCPARRGRSARRLGRVLAGGFGPRLVKGQRGAVTGAMAPAIEAGIPEIAPPGGIRKRDPRFPRPCGTLPRRPSAPGPTEASARPGGGEAPAGGGAGAGRGLWPPAGQGSARRCGRGDGPCHCSGGSAFVSAGGIRKRDPRFPCPRGTVPRRPAGPGPAEGQRPTRRGRSARRGRGGRWPGAMAPGWSRGSVVMWQGRLPRPDRAGRVHALLSFQSPASAPGTSQHAALAWMLWQASPILWPAGPRRQVPQHPGPCCGRRSGPSASACALLWAGRAAIRPIPFVAGWPVYADTIKRNGRATPSCCQSDRGQQGSRNLIG